MYKIGDYIVKSMNGVCRIEDITHLNMPGVDKEKTFYLLVPIEDTKNKIYASTTSIDATTRRVMTKKEALELIDRIPDLEEYWIENNKLRQEKYKEVVKSTNPEALVGIIKMAYTRKQKRLEQGKKNTTVDERYFQIAEKTLYSELGFALSIEKDKVCDMIGDSIRKKQS